MIFLIVALWDKVVFPLSSVRNQQQRKTIKIKITWNFMQNIFYIRNILRLCEVGSDGDIKEVAYKRPRLDTKEKK